MDESNELEPSITARTLGASVGGAGGSSKGSDSKADSSNIVGNSTNRWQQAFRDTLLSGRVGALSVDPEFFVFEPQGCELNVFYK